MSSTAPGPSASTEPTPRALGIGARYSIHPHCDDFVDVILGALAEVEESGLAEDLMVETDEVSTWVGPLEHPAEERIVRYLAAVITAAYRRSNGGHVVAHVLLSRGCPGEVTCDVEAVEVPATAPVRLAPTGVHGTAQWSLYPLMDGTSVVASHMAPIESAIAEAQRSGVAAEPAHYATRLRGDVSDILATAADAWVRVGETVPHVVSHLTISVGSPSEGGRP